MSEIKRVPEKVSGVKDGVQLDAKCVHTRYFKDRMKQTTAECTMMASWENGVLSINFTVDGKRQSVGVRLDETIMLLQEANVARMEAQEGGADEKQ